MHPVLDTRFPNPPGRSERKRSEEHTSELQSRLHLVCRLLLEKKNTVGAQLNSARAIEELRHRDTSPRDSRGLVAQGHAVERAQPPPGRERARRFMQQRSNAAT